jgi:AcrR family transcriptional regulator
VLDEAMRILWRQGEASTGIQDIVTATGISRSSLYATFGGKKQLYLAALRRYVEQRSWPPSTSSPGRSRVRPRSRSSSPR